MVLGLQEVGGGWGNGDSRCPSLLRALWGRGGSRCPSLQEGVAWGWGRVLSWQPSPHLNRGIRELSALKGPPGAFS